MSDPPTSASQPRVAVDNDVLIKISCYRLHREFHANRCLGVLGAARFVVRNRIARSNLNGSVDTAHAAAADLIDNSTVLEPSSEELALAATLERHAQLAGLELDAGESQLASIVVMRRLDVLETGDKRAIRGLDALLGDVPEIRDLAGRVRCLEQVVSVFLETADPDAIGRAICSEPLVDQALSICFRCAAPSPHTAKLDPDGLKSYIATLRENASSVLTV